jgi:hypothetical protein
MSSIRDTQFRVGLSAASLALIAAIAASRFCGSLALPPRPAPPMARGTSSELLARSAAAPGIYLDLVARDAAAAGLPAPTLEQLARALPYRVDQARHVLEVGQPALELAGLRLRLLHLDAALALEITNTTTSDVAYHVATAAIPAAACNPSAALSANMMTIAAGRSETRVECGWHHGVALAVTRVETLEVLALSAWYLRQVPPSLVGIEPRLARGHHRGETGLRCSPSHPQAVRSGLERGEIGWRDLVDFYARHRCETYQFPLTYRMVTSEVARGLPAVSEAM